MTLGTTFSLAVSALFRNKMRSLLTTLGVVIGVAAVIMMQAMGTGATSLVTDEVKSMGSNMLVIVPGGGEGMMGGGMASAAAFEEADAHAIVKEAPAVAAVTPLNTRSVRVVFGEQNRSTTLYGIWPDYFNIRDWKASEGRILTRDDERQASRVCLVGVTVADALFEDQSPIGREVRVHDNSCTIVGLLEGKGTSTFGRDQDDVIFMPLSTFNRRIAGEERVGMMMASIEGEDAIDLGMEQINRILRHRRHVLEGEDDDFSVRDMREVQDILGTVTGVLTTLLASVAAISLLVGGIGIMNIMLVSVTERTREIGVRLAVGARSSDILQQFLLEAIVLSTTGGVIGVGLGTLGALGASKALDIPFTLPLGATALAFAFSVVVGVVFGVFPARKAARLRPIEALRFE
jgi:putative ABC transport system permease protein